MSEKTFLVIIDTTEARFRQTVGRGILNVHVVTATDAFEAKRTLLKNFNNLVQEQIKEYLYAYELETMSSDLKKLEANQLMPLFSFLPLAGGRPERQPYAPVPVSGLGNTTLESNQPHQQQAEPQPPQPQRVVNTTPVPNDVRGRGFQNNDNVQRTTPNPNREQQAILNALGVTPQTFGGNEGNVPRVNAAIGGNVNLQSNKAPQVAPSSITEEQAMLLAGIGIPSDMTVSTPEASLVDESLTKVDDGVLSEEAIQKLRQEVGEA